MLRDLIVHGLGVIEHAELALGDGCNVLTGETGAGKTMIVEALSLLLGGRADRELVRKDARESVIEGRFVVPGGHPVAGLLADRGVTDPTDDDLEFVVTRSVASDGRGKARINGRLVPASLLQELATSLVEIASQHEHRALTTPGAQRAMLDSVAGAETDAAEVARQVGVWRAAHKEMARLESDDGNRLREADILRYEIEEISAAGLTHGEKRDLKGKVARLENSAALTSALATARGALKGEGGALEQLDRAAKALGSIDFSDPALETLAGRIEEARLDVTDAADSLSPPEELDPDALDDMRDRIEAISRLERKYGADEAGLLEHLDRARRRLEEIENFDDRAGEMRRRTEDALTAATRAAAALSKKRLRAARSLEKAVAATLDELAMPGARLTVSFESTDLYEGGSEKISFLVAVNPDDDPRPIAKAASGGELSRIALALRLAATTEVRTFVFDEVDAGVGGRAARAVGRCLASLASQSECQVLVVTHLPQVAAYANAHYRVDKVTEAGSTKAMVERVDAGRRVEELSRMLSGTPESPRAKEHAQELLDAAASG